MKKSLVFALATLLTVAVFSSCNGTKPLTDADLVGYTFQGTDSDGATYTLSFPVSGSFSFLLSFMGTVPYTGTYTIDTNGTDIHLLYTGGVTTETLGSDGPTKLLYQTVVGDNIPETVTLIRQK